LLLLFIFKLKEYKHYITPKGLGKSKKNRLAEKGVKKNCRVAGQT